MFPPIFIVRKLKLMTPLNLQLMIQLKHILEVKYLHKSILLHICSFSQKKILSYIENFQLMEETKKSM